MKARNQTVPPSSFINGVAETMSSDKKDEEMICALTADEHELLQRGLRELPDTMPPRHVWRKTKVCFPAQRLAATAGGTWEPASRRLQYWPP